MFSVGEINIFVTDLEPALKFWAEGLQLDVAEKEQLEHTAYARLDFADGSPSIRIFAQADAWRAGERPVYGTRPMIAFDVTTTDFDAALARLIEFGGSKAGEVEVYDGVRCVFVADPDGNTIELVEVPAGDE